MSALTDLHKAVYDLLTADAGVTATVYDYKPQPSDAGAQGEWIVTGEDDVLAYDSKTFQGSDVLVRIHIWSRYRGFKEVRALQDAVRTALDRADLTVTGQNIVRVHFERADRFVEPDNITHHGVSDFRVIMTEN